MSEALTSRVIILHIRVLTKICIPPEAKDEMEGGLLLDIVADRVRPSSSCLPVSKDEVLLVGRNARG